MACEVHLAQYSVTTSCQFSLLLRFLKSRVRELSLYVIQMTVLKLELSSQRKSLRFLASTVNIRVPGHLVSVLQMDACYETTKKGILVVCIYNEVPTFWSYAPKCLFWMFAIWPTWATTEPFGCFHAVLKQMELLVGQCCCHYLSER